MKNALFSTARRQFLKKGLTTLSAFSALSSSSWALANQSEKIEKGIPSTGESIPVIGLGTSRTFEANTEQTRRQLQPVLQAFFDNGGSLIDSSPMYGSAEATLGRLLANVEVKGKLFSATKVWTEGKGEGVEQMQNSLQLWGRESFDLMQIHNLKDWKTHLATLREWKEQGRIRYIGITTSHNRFHDELADIMRKEPLDFVQFSYNIENRVSEQSLMPLAFDKNIAVLINRPFQRGSLFRKVKGQNVPEWAKDAGMNSWGQFFLKFVVSHPIVTCVIPATSKLKHMQDNMQAGYGVLPDLAMRQKMIDHIEKL